MAMIDAFRDGDIAGAQASHARLFPLCRDLLGVATNPIPVKQALRMLGRGNGELRLPLCPPDEAGLDALKRSLERYGAHGSCLQMIFRDAGNWPNLSGWHARCN